MKIGKYIPLGIYNDVKIGYGTVDFKNLKTIYLRLNSWLSPNDEDDDFNRLISTTKRKIKNHIYNLGNNKFKKECIVDLDIRTKGIKLDKKSFMNLEITLFVNDHFDVKSKEVKSMIGDTIHDIIDSSLDDKRLFNFYKTKK